MYTGRRSWAMFLYKLWFEVFFSCDSGFPYATCGSAPHYNATIFYWLFYAILLTLAGIKLVPSLKSFTAMTLHLDAHYAHALLKKDYEGGEFQRRAIGDRIIVQFFGIAVGW